jgi:hypothetical protein
MSIDSSRNSLAFDRTYVVTVVLFVVGTTVDVGGTVIFVVGFPVTTVDVGGTVLFGVGFVVII